MEEQVTLGELIWWLESRDPEALVYFGFGGLYPESFWSYRGYYEQLAVSFSDCPVTVEEFLKKARSVVGATFTGYKGGKCVMGVETPLWASQPGDVSGTRVVGFWEGDYSNVILTEYNPY